MLKVTDLDFCGKFIFAQIRVRGMKLIFCLWINIRVSCKVVLSLMVGVARHVQSTKNNKFAISF